MSRRSASRITLRLTSVLSVLLVTALIAAPANANGQTKTTVQINLASPPGSGYFGSTITVLPNGNIVVTDYAYSAGSTADVGAVYLYNGATLTLISTLTGSNTDDRISSDGVVVLANGNFVVESQYWNNGSATNAGAVTWCSGTTGCPGVVSAANSLVGTHVYDNIGADGVLALPNGNYVVHSSDWAGYTGAVTWCSGTIGCTGEVSSANSLTGPPQTPQDGLLRGLLNVYELSKSNYVVVSTYWDNGSATDAGAVTWCSGATGCTGAMTESNSLIGTQKDERVGSGVAGLTNGNYVVSSGQWQDGAVTWCSGTTGCTGAAALANTLEGVGGVTVLTNDNYVVKGTYHDSGAALWFDTVTLCSGTTGCPEEVTPANSLIGPDNLLPYDVQVLSNGNYVVISDPSNNGSVTWCSGTTGCAGEMVSPANSLVVIPHLGRFNVPERVNLTILSNDNYVVNSPGVKDPIYGASTWCSGTSGCSGEITAANSLVGSQDIATVGSATALTNGNYVVFSSYYPSGTGYRAATWCSGTTGCTGEVTPANSLVGHSGTGNNNTAFEPWPLTNGNYVVTGQIWDDGVAAWLNASTLCSGMSDCAGELTHANSLWGWTVGSHGVSALTNGNYVVNSPYWVNDTVVDAGAVTWCSGTAGCTGSVSPANSLVGTQTSDLVGSGLYTGTGGFSGGVETLANGSYIVFSPYWDNGTAINTGAFTWGDGAGGTTTGAITDLNSVLLGDPLMNFASDDQYGYLVVGFPAHNRVVVLIQGFKVYLPLVIR